MTILFSLGQLVATPAALRALEESQETFWPYITRHLTGDWGELCAEDKRANDFAVKNEERILSAYGLKSSEKIWIISEWDRSYTTILLPGDY
jgi:hypothetical protein